MVPRHLIVAIEIQWNKIAQVWYLETKNAYIQLLFSFITSHSITMIQDVFEGKEADKNPKKVWKIISQKANSDTPQWGPSFHREGFLSTSGKFFLFAQSSLPPLLLWSQPLLPTSSPCLLVTTYISPRTLFPLS